MNKIVSKMLVLLILVSLLLTGCKGDKKEITQPKLLDPVSVSENSEKVEYREIYNMFNTEVTVVPYPEDLFFNKEGVFSQFHINIGDNVKKGQVLASQSNETYEKELAEEENNYKNIKADYDYQKKLNDLEIESIDAQLNKSKALLKQAEAGEKTKLQSDIDKYNLDKKNLQKMGSSTSKDYEAQMEGVNAKIALIKETMKDNQIVAPYDGVITVFSNIEPGTVVSDDSAIMQIMDTSRTYITGSLEDISILNKADKLYAMFSGKNYDLERCDDLNQKKTESFFLSVLDNSNFTLKNKEKIEFGQKGLLFVISEYKEKALSITSEAVYSEGADQHYVYRMRDGKKEKVNVEIGIETTFYTEITSGLKEGDVVFSE